MNKNNWYNKPEMIVAFSALLISVITAVIGVYSAYIDRAYARASVWPRIEIFRSYGQNNFEYGVVNKGTGPALIKYAKIQLKSKVIQEWREIPGLSNFTQSHIGNTIIPSLAIVTPISITNADVSKVLDNLSSVKIEVCYCSIYDECWVTDKGNQPKPIEICSIDDEHKFLQ
jgi:hypothetical protein